MTCVLVTGANSGIGAAATAALLAQGARVVATVRSADAADRVVGDHPGRSLIVELFDVTDAAEAARLVDRHHPDVVVNAAGDALLGAVMDIDDDDVRRQFETLVIAPLRLARLVASPARDRNGVRLVNVSSSLGSASLPFTGWYSAAKAALDSVTEALRLELGPTGVEVIRVECGAVETPAWDDAGAAVAAGRDGVTAEGRHRWTVLTDLARPHFADPDDVGRIIADAALSEHPRAVYRVGFGSRLGLLSAVVPDRIEELVLRTTFRLRRRSPAG